jgi:predicted GNAT family acetyltransferase
VRFVDAAKDKHDQFVLWEVRGVPVSMAMLRAPAAGVSRIGPVFTPQDRRRNGFGSAATAAAAELAVRRGVTDVVLFADLANPTSNAIYQNIGFQAVADSVRIDFGTVD